MVGWEVVQNKGELLGMLTKVGSQKKAFKNILGV